MIEHKLYSGTYSVLSPKPIELPSNSFKLFIGDTKKALFEIHNQELLNNRLFSGHIIIQNSLKFNFNLINITKLNKLNNRNIFVESVTHTGVDKECHIDTNVIYCSSWVLPIVLNTYRTVNNLYGDCIARRIKINKLQTQSLV